MCLDDAMDHRGHRTIFLAVFGLPRFGPLLDVGLFIVFPEPKKQSLVFSVTFTYFLTETGITPHQEIEHVQS